MSLDTSGTNRRAVLGGIVAASTVGAGSLLRAAEAAVAAKPAPVRTAKDPGRLRQSLCRWTFKTPIATRPDPFLSLAEALEICAV